MAQKKITDLQQRSSVVDACNFVVDDTVQSWRVTAAQLWTFLRGKRDSARTLTAAGTIVDSDEVIFLNPTGGSFTQPLPAVASTRQGRFTFKIIGGGGNTVTLDPNGAELIDTYSTLTLNSDPAYDSVTLFNDGSKWLLM